MYGPKLPELRGKHHPETEAAAGEAGAVAEAIGSTAVGGVPAKTAAARHAVGAR